MTAVPGLDPPRDTRAAAPVPGMLDLSGRVLHVGILPLGARLAMLRVPDRHGTLSDVVLGLDAAGYEADRAYIGATVGRYANRIARGMGSPGC